MTTKQIDLGNLYAGLESLSKSLEGSGRVDEHESPGAYGVVLDAMNFIRAHLAQPQPAPVTREQAIALFEAELCGCEDMYFKARPQIDTAQSRRVFAAGFKAGYEVHPPTQPQGLTDAGLPDDIAAIVACLGDDAAMLRSAADDLEEVAQNMDDAAELIERLAAQPAPVPVPLTPLTLRQIAEVTGQWADVRSDKTIGIARAAIAEFCRVNGITAPEAK